MLKIEIITLKRAQIADNDEMEKFNTRKEFNFIKTVSKPFFSQLEKNADREVSSSSVAKHRA